jgi:hypothetical protein
MEGSRNFEAVVRYLMERGTGRGREKLEITG